MQVQVSIAICKCYVPDIFESLNVKTVLLGLNQKKLSCFFWFYLVLLDANSPNLKYQVQAALVIRGLIHFGDNSPKRQFSGNLYMRIQDSLSKMTERIYHE